MKLGAIAERVGLGRRTPLTQREREIIFAVARAAIPRSERFPGGDWGTVGRVESWFDTAIPAQANAVRAMLWTLETGAVAVTGRPLSRLSQTRAMALLEDGVDSVFRNALRAVLAPIKVAHYDDPTMFAAVGCPSFHDAPPRVAEPARWLAQVTDGDTVTDDLSLECEVVVVGTGAGGATAAFELAERGHAVMLLEEGRYYRRNDFPGRSREAMRKLYREQGVLIAFGNANIPLFAGRLVGGSTAINMGTCYRVRERVFSRWREMGLGRFSEPFMAPYYDRVEATLQVETPSMALTGGVGRVIARGSEQLGLKHSVLRRNAPGCDGQGICGFGCPTGARRSTDVSYVPEALKRGAGLLTSAKVVGLIVEGGRARGVVARLPSGRTATVRADAVIVAAGALSTPLLLRHAKALSRSEALGKNLSIHPAMKVFGLFDETIDMARAIPQGYGIEELADEGIMFEGGSVPLDVMALGIPWVGRRFTRLMDQYRHLAAFGFLTEDTSRGEVRPGLFGSPLVTYHLNDYDVARIQKGTALLAEVFLAAGARRAYTFIPGSEEIASAREITRLRERTLSASNFELTAFHPLGTCRMGTDPRTSVINFEHEAHELEGLFVSDGSALPSSLGVNPQLTIMAEGLRVGEIVSRRLGAQA